MEGGGKIVEGGWMGRKESEQGWWKERGGWGERMEVQGDGWMEGGRRVK